MKKLNLLWRLFTISALLLVIVSIFAVSRPLGDSTLDQISALMPFITAYYIVFGLHMLEKYEERTESVEKKFKGYSFKTW